MHFTVVVRGHENVPLAHGLVGQTEKSWWVEFEP